MDADGSDHVHFRYGSDPDWSPDGESIAYVESDASNRAQVHVMGSNNTGGGAALTDGTANNFHPRWSPDNQIAFVSDRDGNSEIYVMDLGGDVETRLTNDPGADRYPEWSPDGQKIAFVSNRDGNDEIYVMNSDGSSPTRLTTTPMVGEYLPDWQPIPADMPTPASATPVRVPLVPAFEPCTAPNRYHGPGLAADSCAAPVPSGLAATLGPRSIGYVKLEVVPGSPASPGDRADVRVSTSITDVRRRSDGADLPGPLDLPLPVRITDRDSGGARVTPATVVQSRDYLGNIDYVGNPFHFTVPCVETPAATTGATCSVESTVDALVPGSPSDRKYLTEGKSANWEFDQIALYDGGEDGFLESLDDNTQLARQGVFVP
jgi:hypothetical protein